MSYISFDKIQLINLEFALSHELLRSNRSGAYSSTTIAGCNTRKYHGLLVVPQPQLDHNNHILLSSIDETIIQQNEAFNFAVRMYPNGVYNPKGHKYLREFTASPIPKITYRVGGVILSKELLFSVNEPMLLIRYTLDDAHSQTTLRLKPFLAFRNIHQLTTANIDANNKYEPAVNGVSWQMYSGYSRMYFQLSKEAEYTHIPDWYFNIEYIREKERGFHHTEDLFVPGFFDVALKKGESIIVAVGLDEVKPENLKKLFSAEIKKRIPRDNFENCLLNAAEQFLVKGKNKTEVMAGFPWFGTWGRDTFIALPGITLSRGDETSFKAVIDTMVAMMKGPFFPNIGRNNQPDYASVDAPLWFFWSLQQYAAYKGNHSDLWKKYKKPILTILDAYRKGTTYNVAMHDSGLISAGGPGMALTWMDVFSNGKPVTPRSGMPVEVNALWYNAICFALELAKIADDKVFVAEWDHLPKQISNSFVATFWDETRGYLADVVCEGNKDFTIRPNMLFAVSLPYSPVNEEIQNSILNRIKSDLLTDRGLRTLTPTHPKYKGICTGNQQERDMAYHQGTVFPWLISHFSHAWLHLHGKSGLSLIENLYTNFESAIFEVGLGTISEIFDGDPPHESRGAISQAWSVAALINMKEIIIKTKQTK